MPLQGPAELTAEVKSVVKSTTWLDNLAAWVISSDVPRILDKFINKPKLCLFTVNAVTYVNGFKVLSSIII